MRSTKAPRLEATVSEIEPLPWEQQSRESAKAYAAFCAYRDLGPRRSLRAAAEKFYGRNTSAATRQCAGWSSTFRWVKRAHAWDRHLDEEAREAQEQARRDMAQRQAQEAKALQGKAIERLRSLRPEELGPSDVLRFFIEAATLERLALGEPETVQRQELTGRGGAPLRFTLEDAVAAAREWEDAKRDRLQRDGR
jgi:hypothetical protein